MQLTALKPNLKSNMDRFIGILEIQQHMTVLYLKSNMDRFIGCLLL